MYFAFPLKISWSSFHFSTQKSSSFCFTAAECTTEWISQFIEQVPIDTYLFPISYIMTISKKE